ncbi:unnamed protein product [Meganyctiphanes norvegica]|uniref:Nephrin n=1 Tax=Meganyctiphanes norvegica TaxID=48144 RepID=A0AAV2Q8I7_MEGNR
MAGPYLEGGTLRLTCITIGGFPAPNVTWWRGGLVLDASQAYNASTRETRNALLVTGLTRDWHNDTLTCEAYNTDFASPVSTRLTVEMYLYPRKLTLQSPDYVVEGDVLTLGCVAEGSHPPAVLTWSREGFTQPGGEVSHVGTLTTSLLNINVSRKDDGIVISCRATNPPAKHLEATMQDLNVSLYKPNSTTGFSDLSESTVLSVHYAPRLVASFGANLKPETLKVGDDVYFSCEVTAKPPADATTWYHEETRLVQNVSLGVILTWDSLVLQRVDRQRAGRYSCRASNSVNTSSSNLLYLNIKYPPNCQTPATTYFIFDKPINISCSVTSYPPVPKILWRWNNSGDIIYMDPITIEGETVTSEMTVYPTVDQEDRTLTCWGENQMGKQERTCTFYVKTAQMPAPLSSCRLANITTSSLSLTCQRPDTPKPPEITLYRAEVYLHNNTLLANVTSSTPSFNVSHLKSDTSYQIKVYVSQGPATSEPVVVSGYTSRTSRIEIVVPEEPESHVGIYAGAGAGVLLVVVVIVAARSYCRREHRPGGIHTYKEEHSPSCEDSNPDIISNIDDTYVQMTESMGGGFTGEVTITRSPSGKNIAVGTQSISKKQTPMCRADYCLAVEMRGATSLGSYSSSDDTQVLVPASSYNIQSCPISSSGSSPCHFQGGSTVTYPVSSGMVMPCLPPPPSASSCSHECHSAGAGVQPPLIANVAGMGCHIPGGSGMPFHSSGIPCQQAPGGIQGYFINTAPEGYSPIPQLNIATSNVQGICPNPSSNVISSSSQGHSATSTVYGICPMPPTSVISSSSQGLCPVPQASSYTCPVIAINEPLSQIPLLQQNDESFV